MDVMRGLGENGEPTRLAGVENLMLHFTPYAEDWSKLPVIVSGGGSHVTDDRGRRYIDGLAGLFTTQVGHGRAELAEVAARQMKELGFFPNWSFQHPRSLELAAKIAEIAPEDLNSTFFVSSGSEAVETVIKLARQYPRGGLQGRERGAAHGGVHHTDPQRLEDHQPIQRLLQPYVHRLGRHGGYRRHLPLHGRGHVLRL